MSRKSNDAPLKLIQLVPSHGKEEVPSLSSSEAYDQGLRLQIGIEGEPSWGTRISDVLSRVVPRNSNRYVQNQKVGEERDPIQEQPGRGRRVLAQFRETVQSLFHYVGNLLSGCTQALVSMWSRFQQSDEDLDDLVQARLDRRDPRRSGDSLSSQEVTREVDHQADALARELQALREEFNAQQYELSRVNNFVVDLKSRVLAQQKMILSLAEELDAVAMEVPSSVKEVSKEPGAVQRH